MIFHNNDLLTVHYPYNLYRYKFYHIFITWWCHTEPYSSLKLTINFSPVFGPQIPYLGFCSCEEQGDTGVWQLVDPPILPLTHGPNHSFDWRETLLQEWRPSAPNAARPDHTVLPQTAVTSYRPVPPKHWNLSLFSLCTQRWRQRKLPPRRPSRLKSWCPDWGSEASRNKCPPLKFHCFIVRTPKSGNRIEN